MSESAWWQRSGTGHFIGACSPMPAWCICHSGHDCPSLVLWVHIGAALVLPVHMGFYKRSPFVFPLWLSILLSFSLKNGIEKGLETIWVNNTTEEFLPPQSHTSFWRRFISSPVVPPSRRAPSSALTPLWVFAAMVTIFAPWRASISSFCPRYHSWLPTCSVYDSEFIPPLNPLLSL